MAGHDGIGARIMATTQLQWQRVFCILAITLASSLSWADVATAQPTPKVTRPLRQGQIWPDADAIMEYFRKLPEHSPGVTLISAPVMYNQTTVSQWQGQGAEELLKYQYEWSVNAVFAAAGMADALNVTFHKMSTLEDAYGVFTLRRHRDSDLASTVPVRAYWTGKSLHVWRGPFYAQVEVPADNSTSREMVLQVATDLMTVLPVPRRLPPMLNLLPMRIRQIGNPVYYYGAAPEYEFGVDAVTVMYEESYDQQLDYALIRLNDSTAAISAYSDIVAQLSEGIHEVHEMPQIADHASLIISAESALWSVVQQDEFVAVIKNAHDEEFVEALMRMTATNIRIYLLFAP